MATTVGTASVPAVRAPKPAVETVTLGRTTAPRYMTLEQFEDFDWTDDVEPELVRGEVRLSPMSGFAHARIVRNIFRALDAHATANDAGEVFGDGTGYVLVDLPQTYRGPDVSFVRAGKLPALAPIKGAARVTPDLAVEVLSPSERRRDTGGKIADLFAAGTAVVWIVNPRTRQVTIRTPDGTHGVLVETDALDGVPVLPAFTTRVSDVFAGVAAPTPRRRGKSA